MPNTSDALDALERSAVLTGALWCLLLAVPAAVVQSVLADDDGGTDQSAWVFVALFAIVTAYLLGGAMAGRRALDAPFLNGAAAAFSAFAVVQIVGIIVRLTRGDGVSPVALVFNALLAASIGTVGAWFGARRGAATLGLGGTSGASAGRNGQNGGDGESAG